MNRKEIIAEFVKYCNDKNIDTKKQKSQLIFTNDLIAFLYNYDVIELKEIEATQKYILNILKYNALTIEKLKNKYKKMGV